MSRVVIIGAHGKVALLAIPLLVAEGHEVTGVIRDPNQSDAVTLAGATPAVADVEEIGPEQLVGLLRGHDVVVWSAGAGGGNPDRTRAVDREAAIASMDAATAAGVERYVMVSYLGSRPDHGVDPESSFFHYAEAKAAADEHLRNSRLSWTILGPGALTLEPGTGRVEVAERPTAGSVPRADVAAVLAAVVGRPDTAGLTIPFNSGETPVDEALDAATGA